MTVNEAIQRTQGRGVGIFNRPSARHAQTLILPEEKITAAVVANIATHNERFPGVVVITDRRVMAVCGLPGIRRSIVCNLDQLEKCEGTPSAIHYTATFSTKINAFSLTVDPDVGETFARHLAVLNGEVEAFDAVNEIADSGILNPTLVRARLRARQAKNQARAKREIERKAAHARFGSQQKKREVQAPLDSESESAQDVARRLQHELKEAKAKGRVDNTDPKAVAARLAAELAAEEVKKNKFN